MPAASHTGQVTAPVNTPEFNALLSRMCSAQTTPQLLNAKVPSSGKSRIAQLHKHFIHGEELDTARKAGGVPKAPRLRLR